MKPFHWRFQNWNNITVAGPQKSEKKLEKLFNLKEVSVCLERLSLDLQNGQVDLRDENVTKKLLYFKSKQMSLQNEKKSSHSASLQTTRKQKFVSKNKDQNKDQHSGGQRQQRYNRCTLSFPNMYNLSQSSIVILVCVSFLYRSNGTWGFGQRQEYWRWVKFQVYIKCIMLIWTLLIGAVWFFYFYFEFKIFAYHVEPRILRFSTHCLKGVCASNARYYWEHFTHTNILL